MPNFFTKNRHLDSQGAGLKEQEIERSKGPYEGEKHATSFTSGVKYNFLGQSGPRC